MAEQKGTGGTGGTGGSGGTGGTGGSGQKTLEMRVAELEDRLAKVGGSEGQGTALPCSVPCIPSCICTAAQATSPVPCIQQCIIHHCIPPCVIQHCIIQHCIQQCIAQQATAPSPCIAAQQGVHQSCIAQQGVQSCIAQQPNPIVSQQCTIYHCIRCIIRCIIDPIIFNPPNECIPGCAPGGGSIGGGGFGSLGM
jgi:hypothetical protein